MARVRKLPRIYHSERITRRSEILSGWATTLKQIEHNNEIVRSTLGRSAKCRRLFRRRSGLRSQRRHCRATGKPKVSTRMRILNVKGKLPTYKCDVLYDLGCVWQSPVSAKSL
jgi:hypothetical protein